MKKGYTLYNNLADYYFTNEIKVASQISGKLIIIVFYNSSLDFYFVAPFIQNLIFTMKYVCESKELSLNKIKKKYVDINTMLQDTIGLFNCFTRVVSNDFEAYLGSDVIFNQMCFTQLKKGDLEMASLFRLYWGKKKYDENTKIKINEQKSKNIGLFRKTENEKIKIGPGFKKIFAFNNAMKNSRSKKYLGKKIYNDIDTSNEVKIEKFLTYNNRYFKEKENIDIVNTGKNDKAKFKETMRTNAQKENKIKNLQTFHTTSGLKENSIDLLGINLYDNEGEKTEVKSTIGGYPILNNVSNTYLHEESKNDDVELVLDTETIANINKNTILVNSVNMVIDSTKLNKNSNNSLEESKNNHHKVSYNNISKSPILPQPIYNSISLAETDLLDLSTIDFTKNNDIKRNKSVHYNQAKYHTQTSITQSYNSTSMSTPPQNTSIGQPNYQSLESKFKITPTPIPTTGGNNNSNINLSTFNSYITPINQSRNVNTQSSIQKTSYINNNPPSNYGCNSMISTYNKFQTTNLNMPMSLNLNGNVKNSTTYTSTNSCSQILPNQTGMNFSSFQQPYINSSQFSQEDMSFLSGTSQTTKKELPEDYLNINKNNPEVFADLREKLFFYYNSKSQLINMDSKGYIGITIKQNFKINRKTMFLMILQPNWKSEVNFQKKEFDKALMYKITETNYHIDIINKTGQVKLLTYTINLSNFASSQLVSVNFFWNQNIFEMKFGYNTTVLKISNVYKMTINLVFNRNFQNCNFQANGKVSKVKENEYIIYYQNAVQECKILFNSLINQVVVEKVIIRYEMKNGIISKNDIRVSFNNSVSSQENLKVNKMALLSFEYNMI